MLLPEQRKPLLIFCDPGIDDALALLWLLIERFYYIRGIVAVADNTTADNAFLNLLKIICISGSNHVPIYTSANISQNYHLLPNIHGNDSLGDLNLVSDNEYIEEGVIQSGELNEAEIRCLSSDPSYNIISLGPLTVVAYYLKKALYPPVEITIMGGLLKETGNYKGNEFNFGLDLIAAQDVLNYQDCLLKLVPLDLTRQFWLRQNFLETFKRPNKKVDYFRQFGEAYLDLTFKRGDAYAYPHDLTAAIALTCPDLFRWRSGLIKIGGSTLRLSVGKKDLIAAEITVTQEKFEAIIKEWFRE